MTRLASASVAGSSPLARGGPSSERSAGSRQRLIPARAGRTSSRDSDRSATSAHPRSRGADRRRHDDAVDVGGLIPARAGRTHGDHGDQPCAEAHPRSRGADSGLVDAAKFRAGSSPLARGGQPRRPQQRAHRGLIPARAGRTWLCRPRRRGPRAHPRSRGADTGRRKPSQALRGSSPLARGGPHRHRRVMHPRRLIPARAGRTGPAEREGHDPGAHPRSRGADKPLTRKSLPLVGSSPLARGGPRRHPLAHHERGLIPARAGRTGRIGP